MIAILLTLILVRAIPLPDRLTVPPSTVVAFADGSPAYVFLSPDDKYRMAVTAEDLAEETIDPDYLDALMRFEDKRFFHHPGVDFVALARSVLINLYQWRPATGASTVTMQLVRLVEPRPRTLTSKAIEIVRALQLEARMSKREVLAAYLSFLPYGRNVEGVTAASWAYFGHGPHDLSPEEIAVLLAVPQRPTSRYPTAANVERLRAARDEIAEWLIDRGTFAPGPDIEIEAFVRQLRTAAVPVELRPLPRHAPHAAFWLRAQPRDDSHRIETTLDRGLQLLSERLMGAAHSELASQGIHNGAAVIVDHHRAEVRALVGNFDFWDENHGGQITGFATARSPGSALKPFIYALAIDRGLALPDHLVADVPVFYRGYAPGNYDGKFAGLVALEDALSRSLNIPFVRLLNRVGVERFIGTLQAGGAAGLQAEPGYYGLSAAIGSVEITPLELAGLYAGLAQEGRYRPLRWLAAEDGSTAAPVITGGTRLFSRGSAFLTRRALARRDRPDFPDRRRLSGAPPAIHWKTGTSYGHRDAWAAGSGPDATAVVWLGNFDNRPSLDLVGAEAAGPLLFDLLEAVADRSMPAVTPRPPADLKKIEVCAYSGHLPTRACEQRRFALALRHQVPTRRCPYHVAVEVDLDSGLALNPSCRGGRRWQRRNYVVWPASIRRWLTEGHRFLPNPPSLDPRCLKAGERTPPAILSPPAGQVLVLLPGVAVSDQEVPLQAESRSGSRLSWFVDGELVGTADAEERVWWQPRPGRHEIVVVDDAGLSAKGWLEVRSRSG
ncbi:MAG: penicillin-binding protein 1C [Thermoanaerobaculia bacterium]